MGYKPFLKQRHKPVIYVEPHPTVKFKRRSWLGRFIQRVLLGSPPQAVPKHRMVVYDYTPKHGLMPKTSVPFHSKIITSGVILTGLSIVWSLNEPSIAFYEPADERNAIKQLSAPDPQSELKQFATGGEAFREHIRPPEQIAKLVEAAPSANLAEEIAEPITLGSLLNPISMEEVLESFSYPSNPLIQLSPGSRMTEISVPPLGESEPDNEAELDMQAEAEGEAPPRLAEGWHTITIQSGDNLSRIFSSYGLDRNDLQALRGIKELKQLLRKLQVGQQVHLHIGENNRVDGLKMEISPIEELHIARGEADVFSAQVIQREVETRMVSAKGQIRSSLYNDGRKAGLDDALLRQMTKIFAYDIDFALDLQSGDRFAVIYEEAYYQGKKVRTGQIKAAEFINGGTVYRAVAYTDKDGRVTYYTPDGKGLEKAFLRTPVNVVNITSGFGSRLHPILNKIRAHKGVDYSAPTGTPVFASGKGKIAFAGWKNGYGKTIIIDHGDKYQTVYAHLSKLEGEPKVGERVHQGDLIGYVGSTGMATGPHLHYEFLVDGEHQDPLSVVLPSGIGIAAEEKADFLAQTNPLVAQLNQASTLAQAGGEQNAGRN
jgi:murein DD-endopeptidase MepM/ murein hydrolase activator NlpD